MPNYINFKKNNLFIDTEFGKVALPTYVAKSVIRFRFNLDQKELEKQCNDCNCWFIITKLKDLKWKDIHDENKIHITKKGTVNGKCNKCRTIRFQNCMLDFTKMILNSEIKETEKLRKKL